MSTVSTTVCYGQWSNGGLQPPSSPRPRRRSGIKTRNCSACAKRKALREFHKQSWTCKICKSTRSLQARRADLPRTLWLAAKRRAETRGLPFNITIEDIAVPTYCPILGIRLTMSRGRAADHSPSLDRINSKRGYTRGNIQVISWRANSLKKDATLKELLQLGLHAQAHIKRQS